MTRRRSHPAIIAARVPATSTAIIDDPFTGADGSVPSATYWGTVAKSASAIVDINNNNLRMADSAGGGSTIYNEPFTGGPALPTAWTQVSGTADRNNNQLRLLTPAATAYGVGGAYYNPGTPLPQDYEMTFDMIPTTVDAAEFYGGINVRAASTAFTDIKQRSSWHFRLTGTSTLGVGELYRVDSAGAGTLLQSAADIDFVQGSVIHFRILLSSNNIKMRYWKNAESEPGTWNIDYTDATPPSGSMISFTNRNGNQANQDDWRVDNLVISGAGAAAGAYDDWGYLPGLPTVTDFEITCDMIIPGPSTAEQYNVVGFRGSGTRDTTDNQQNKQTTGYFVEVGVRDNYVMLVKRTGGVDTPLGLTVGIDWNDNDIVHLKINAVGSIISFKAWRNNDPEPGTWGTSVTDATYSSGKVWLGHVGGSAAVSTTIRWDWILAVTSVTPGHGTDTSGGGGGGSSYTDPPIASAISGMSSTPYKNYDFISSVGDFGIVDGDDTPNNERSASKPSNVTFVAEGNTSGGFFMRMAMRRETYAGQPFSGVQMENFFSGPNPGRVFNSQTLKGYGQGSPFFVEARLRWVGFEGFWCGPWMYDLTPPAAGAEIDIMETINNRPAKTTLHSPNVATFTYVGGNDGQWHRFGLRVDTTGIKYYMDNVLVNTVNNSSIGSAFVNANMGFKFQAFVGGNWPDDDLGLARGTTPRANVPFPQFFECDWLRLYR